MAGQNERRRSVADASLQQHENAAHKDEYPKDPCEECSDVHRDATDRTDDVLGKEGFLMASEWQQWYPHVIDAWQASATVQAFTDAAYRGFHNLLMAQFQTEDGKLPADVAQLAKLSRMGPKWKRIADEVLPEFERDEAGRLFNRMQYKQWSEAHKRHESYLVRTQRMNDARNHARDHAGEPARDHADGIHATTETVDRDRDRDSKEKDSCAEASSTPVDPVLFFPLANGTEFAVERDRMPGWQQAFPGTDVMQELYMMREWLQANPKRRKTARGVTAFVVSWLTRAQDRGKPGGGGNGSGNGFANRGQQRTDGNVEAARRAAAAIVNRHSDGACGGAPGSGERQDAGTVCVQPF
jgi:uncharacterized protein YdaU (DUF1376 family)